MDLNREGALVIAHRWATESQQINQSVSIHVREPEPEHPHKSGGSSNRKAPPTRENLATIKSASLSFCASTLSSRILSFSRSRSAVIIAPMSKTAISPLSLTLMSRRDGRE
ncbi:hypothetical protein Pdw03_1606 [Penicillium digitatum]|uniref:Uncharacterized protein n=1 Tax=Penicillium digitatum TaxID=36651 RepID=A0A7T6XT67_PENDI|nr:hypothetical protein Pdw03_1606 [Penicillium digitatum]